MTDLSSRVDEYLAIRRALGYKLNGHDAMLHDLARWLTDHGDATLTSDAAVAWAQSRPTSGPARQAQRLSVVRRFAEYLSSIDPATEVPGKELLPARYQRTAPYIYSPAEIAALMRAARSLSPPLKAATYETLIGLLACTGLRYGEAVGLDRDDVNLAAANLLVRHAKSDRQRHVVIHATTVAALSAYAAQRDRLCPHAITPSFLLSDQGARLASSTVQAVFAALRRQCGLQARHDAPRLPRLHDLRHTFIVRTMLAWHSDGLDVQPRLPLLSTYVGHVDPKATYYYQQAVPELLALAADKLDRALDATPTAEASS